MKLGLKFGFKMLLVWRLCAYVRDRRLRAALQTQEASIGQENIPKMASCIQIDT